MDVGHVLIFRLGGTPWSDRLPEPGSRLAATTEAQSGRAVLTAAAPYRVTKHNPVGLPTPEWGAPLDVYCWCGRAFASVAHADVLAGRTFTCHRHTCSPPPGTLSAPTADRLPNGHRCRT